MTTGQKNILVATLACWIGFGLVPAIAQEPAANEDTSVSYRSVNGWDLRTMGPEETTNSGARCTLSTTMLGDPRLGLQGGRATVRFENSENGVIAAVVVSGGVDGRSPIEIWVDDHLIADQNAATSSVSFSAKSSAGIVTLFKAGRKGSIRFRRNGQARKVPLSLTGFTKAARTFQAHCPVLAG